MPSLRNLQHERFAQRVAHGEAALEAFTAVGITAKHPAKAAAQLKWRLAERMSEISGDLREAAKPAIIDRAAVLAGLWSIATDRRKSDSARLRAYELCGKAVGVFEPAEHTEYVALAKRLVNGDLSALTDEQLEHLHRLVLQSGAAPRPTSRQLAAAGSGGGGAGAGEPDRILRNTKFHRVEFSRREGSPLSKLLKNQRPQN
jgi:hypothetical protein